MLICKGTNVRFVMEDGRKIATRGAMLHDPSGRYWSKNSLLIASFPRGGRLATDAEKQGTPREYLGRLHPARVSRVTLPPKPMSEWKPLGQIRTILYARPGTKAPGKYFHHFGGRRIQAFFKSGKAFLYKRGSAYRVEADDKTIYDDRGLVYP